MKKLLTILIIFLGLNAIIGLFIKPNNNQEIKKGEIVLTTPKNSFGLESLVTAEIQNNTDKIATIKNDCPNEPLNVFENVGGQWVAKTQTAKTSCEGTKDIVINPGEKSAVNYDLWNHALFGELGRYKLSANVSLQDQTETKTIESPEFQIEPQGTFGFLWGTLFFQPIYNILILLISIVPGKNLGLAIILLTLIIRTILLIPNQKALKAQRKLQEVQPKLNKIREQHKGDQEAIARETMNIWKEHKVNPFGSCLPMLIQFPILIALYYVIRSGLNPDNAYLLYGALKNFNFEQINVNFLNLLDLTKINYLALPLIVGGLQFFQMKLAMVRGNMSKKKEDKILPASQEKKKEEKNEMEIANSMMIYMMPVMIAIFTASVASGVGLYWATSTLYGICQQLVVNRQADQEKAKVKVLK